MEVEAFSSVVAVLEENDSFAGVVDCISFDAEVTKPLAMSLLGLTTISDTLKPVEIRPFESSMV